MYRIWVNTDDTGKITDTVGGHEDYIVEPSEEYQHYFYVDEYTFKHIELFIVVNNELVKAE